MSLFLIHIFIKNQPATLANNSCLNSWSIYIYQESTYHTSQDFLSSSLFDISTKNQSTSLAKKTPVESIYPTHQDSCRINLPHSPRILSNQPTSLTTTPVESTYLTRQESCRINLPHSPRLLSNQPTSLAKNPVESTYLTHQDSCRINLPHSPRILSNQPTSLAKTTVKSFYLTRQDSCRNNLPH